MSGKLRVKLIVFAVDEGAEVTFSSIRLDWFKQFYPHTIPGLPVLARVPAAPKHLLDHRAYKNHKANERRDRISCQANKRDILIISKSKRFARAHIDPPKIQYALFFDHSLDESKEPILTPAEERIRSVSFALSRAAFTDFGVSAATPSDMISHPADSSIAPSV